MRINRTELADLGTFLAIARHRSFRRAGQELGVSASALSHALKVMEARLGVRLVNRTSRSVTLTAAGEDLLASLDAPFAAIGSALDLLNQHREPKTVTGRIRLNVLEHASTLLLAPVVPLFHARHPQVEIDVRVSNDLLDIVEAGADAGIRYGGTVPQDMVAQRLSADLRWVVVGAPRYFDRHGTPDHPCDLAAHRCLRIRLGDDRLYRWEFERADEQIALDVPGAVTIDNTQFALSLATQAAGSPIFPSRASSPRSRAASCASRWRTGHRGDPASTSTIPDAANCRSACASSST